jgi:hypothetical protein
LSNENHEPEIYEGDDGSFYTVMQILKSAAGYYIGRMFWDNTEKFWEPGSRESGYFTTREEAERAMLDGFEWRDASENVHFYTSKGLTPPVGQR